MSAWSPSAVALTGGGAVPLAGFASDALMGFASDALAASAAVIMGASVAASLQLLVCASSAAAALPQLGELTLLLLRESFGLCLLSLQPRELCLLLGREGHSHGWLVDGDEATAQKECDFASRRTAHRRGAVADICRHRSILAVPAGSRRPTSQTRKQWVQAKLERRYYTTDGFHVHCYERHPAATLSTFDLRDVELLQPSVDPSAPAPSMDVHVGHHAFTLDFGDEDERDRWMQVWMNGVPTAAVRPAQQRQVCKRGGGSGRAAGWCALP